MGERLAIHGGMPLRERGFARWPEYGDPEQRALKRVLDSYSWGGFPSPNTEARAFELAFARYLGCSAAVPCVNGTFALTLALQAARISPGAEVITSAYTFVGTAGGILAAGAVPVFVDVLPDTYCLDPALVEQAITPRTEAVVAVHLADSMADMDRLPELCAGHELLLVEDCAHAHGASWRGRRAGTLGDLGGFSMQSTKLLTAGEGGAVTTSNADYDRRLRALINCGRLAADGTGEPMLGHNLRMTEWQAAVLREQLERLPEQHTRRRTRRAVFERALSELPGLSLSPVDPRVSERTFYQTIVRYDRQAFADVPRDAVIAALNAEGVPCSGRFYVPLPEDPLFARDPLTNHAVRAGIDYTGLSFPVAARAAYEESIWLPHWLFLGTEADARDVAGAFRKVQQAAESLRDGSTPRG